MEYFRSFVIAIKLSKFHSKFNVRNLPEMRKIPQQNFFVDLFCAWNSVEKFEFFPLHISLAMCIQCTNTSANDTHDEGGREDFQSRLHVVVAGGRVSTIPLGFTLLDCMCAQNKFLYFFCVVVHYMKANETLYERLTLNMNSMCAVTHQKIISRNFEAFKIH